MRKREVPEPVSGKAEIRIQARGHWALLLLKIQKTKQASPLIQLSPHFSAPNHKKNFQELYRDLASCFYLPFSLQHNSQALPSATYESWSFGHPLPISLNPMMNSAESNTEGPALLETPFLPASPPPCWFLSSLTDHSFSLSSPGPSSSVWPLNVDTAQGWGLGPPPLLSMWLKLFISSTELQTHISYGQFEFPFQTTHPTQNLSPKVSSFLLYGKFQT